MIKLFSLKMFYITMDVLKYLKLLFKIDSVYAYLKSLYLHIDFR